MDYFVAYKPYHVLSQFSKGEGKQTLADYFNVPKNVYPLGRLDYDSEGLLLLTNDKALNYRLLHPAHAHTRTYWAQVEGDITEEAINQLINGIKITIDSKSYFTKPAEAKKFISPPQVPPRIPPVRFRKNISTSWITLTLIEGKNHQVRKMTAATGFPTLRLIRYSINNISLQAMQPGDLQEWERDDIYVSLFGTKL